MNILVPSETGDFEDQLWTCEIEDHIRRASYKAFQAMWDSKKQKLITNSSMAIPVVVLRWLYQ